jgi:branched-chain amino acid transport system ATP-binding protein
MTPLLALHDVDAHYGDLQALFGVSLEAHEGEIVAIVGANAAGKSTAINVISGLVRTTAGRVELGGERIDHVPPHRIVERGIVQIPEGRQLFPYMTVAQNLEMGAYTPAARERRHETLEEVFELLPLLRERRDQLAVQLSGGEQQMCAIARGLMARPRLLMIDEPFLGLSPLVVQQLGGVMRRIRDEQGISIVFIEQNVELALRLADRGYILESGRTILTGSSAELLQSAEVKRIFLGDVAL